APSTVSPRNDDAARDDSADESSNRATPTTPEGDEPGRDQEPTDLPDTAAPPPRLPPTSRDATGRGGAEPVIPRRPKRDIVIELSLDEAIRVGLEKNFDIRIARLDHLTSYHDEVIAQSAFDPFFSMGLDFSKNRRPTASFLDIGGGALISQVQPNPSETLSAFVGIRGLTPIGTLYDV